MATYEPTYTASYALIIGINTYQHPEFTPLGNAEDDANQMAEVLKGGPYHFQVQTLFGAEATKGRIETELFRLRSANPDDRVLVYFAGHGYTLYDRNNHPTGFIAAYDTVPDRDYTALELLDVTDLTRHSPAKHIAFILDSCYSAAALGFFVPRDSVAGQRFLKVNTYQALTAGEQVVDDTHSMTKYILEALRDDNYDPDTGLFTLSDLGEVVRDQLTVDTQSRQIPQIGYLKGSRGGEFILRMQTGPRLPGDVTEALRSENGFVRAGAVEGLVEIARRGGETAPIAVERLNRMLNNDPDPRVREAAQAYFDSPDAPDPVPPRPTPPPTAAPPVDDRAEAAPLPQGALIGGGIAGVLVIGLLLAALFGAFRGEQASPSAEVTTQPTLTDEPTATDEPTSTPTVQPSATPTIALISPGATQTPPPLTNTAPPPTREPALVLAESGEVAANAEWQPYTQSFDGVEMALVPAGCFKRGSDIVGDENPVHTVCFEQPFWLDVYEVTNAQFGSEGRFSGDDLPRDLVTWAEAANFCEARGGRLPTEAEWEYAARGPDALIFPWGNVFFADNVVYRNNSQGSPASVGSRPKGVSWVGAYDLSGNVYEWVSDWYSSTYYLTLPDTITDPQGPRNGTNRVIRGGAFTTGVENSFRGSARLSLSVLSRDSDIGFRCARTY